MSLTTILSLLIGEVHSLKKTLEWFMITTSTCLELIALQLFTQVSQMVVMFVCFLAARGHCSKFLHTLQNVFPRKTRRATGTPKKNSQAPHQNPGRVLQQMERSATPRIASASHIEHLQAINTIILSRTQLEGMWLTFSKRSKQAFDSITVELALRP